MPRCTGSGAPALPADSPLFVSAPVVCIQYPQYTPRVPRPAPERAGRRARDGQAVDAPALPPRHAVFVGFSPGLFAKRPRAPRRSALQLPHGSAGALVCLHFVFLHNSRRSMALSRRRFASSDSASRLCGPRRGADPAALFLSLRTCAPAPSQLRATERLGLRPEANPKAALCRRRGGKNENLLSQQEDMVCCIMRLSMWHL